MKDYTKEIAGMECSCYAYHAGECSCGVDWRDSLNRAIDDLVDILDDKRAFELEIDEIANDVFLTPEAVECIQHFVALLYAKTHRHIPQNSPLIKKYK